MLATTRSRIAASLIQERPVQRDLAARLHHVDGHGPY